MQSWPAVLFLLLLVCTTNAQHTGHGEREATSSQISVQEDATSALPSIAEEEDRELASTASSPIDSEHGKSDGNSSNNGTTSSTAYSSDRQLAHTGPECGEDGSGLNAEGVPCKYAYEKAQSLYVDGYIDHTITGAQLTNGRYPSTTLSCYSSFTKPDGMLICPESRSKYCVKELSTLKQDLCGQSQYFGDQYLDNLCVLRKCASECKEGQYSFQYGGLTYVRMRYCCQENYCNSSSKAFASATLLTFFAVFVSCVCMMY